MVTYGLPTHTIACLLHITRFLGLCCDTLLYNSFAVTVHSVNYSNLLVFHLLEFNK